MKRLAILGPVLAVVVLLAMTATPVMAKGPPTWAPPAVFVLHVHPGDSIQDAIDDADPGEKVLVHAGVYHQSVVFGPEDSGITLKGEPGAILDGTGAPGVDGITLLAGVSGVTIEGFEIRNYSGPGTGQGNAIQAWNDGTSDITIENNVMHDNSWNAILVGNEGTGLHTGWHVRHNHIYANGVYSLELTNAQDSEIRGNIVEGGVVGILVQARNTIPESGMVTVSDVRVMDNTVSGAAWTGIYILAMASGPTPPFDPIVGAWSTLEDIMVQRNEVDQSGAGWGAWVYGYLSGRVYNARIIHNAFISDGGPGVGIFTGVINAKVVNNTFTNCNPEVYDGGEATKIPPVGRP